MPDAWKEPAQMTAKPTDHPPVPKEKIGVLLSNLGTPDGTDYWSMRRYLGEFLSDRRVIDYSPLFWQPLLQLVILTSRPFRSGAAYRSIWNEEKDESPLLTISRNQAEKLAEALHGLFGDMVEVEFCMRYGNPSTEAGLKALSEKGCRRILFMPLYPQYSATTTATANDQFFRALMRLRWQPSVRTLPPYFENPLYIDALARSVTEAVSKLEARPDVVVTSYHGLPKRYLKEGDPYYCHCMKTTRLLRERLGLSEDEMVATFQSRFGPEEWLQPYTVEKVAELARNGKKNIAVMAPAFAADCLETLEEINEEIRESFLSAGGETFTYIPCLNDSVPHIELLADLVQSNLAGWVEK